MAKEIESVTVEDLENVWKGFANMETNASMHGISREELEAAYNVGFGFYNTGRYDDAETIFKFLAMFNHLEQKYWIALGAAQQMKKEYAKAVVAYGYSAMLDISNPKPQYYAAECYSAQGDKENALSALECLEQFCPRDTEVGREFRKKAAQLKARLENDKETTEGA